MTVDQDTGATPGAGTAACAVCGAGGLEPHMSVRRSQGAELVPTTDAYGSALSDIVRCVACGHMQLGSMPAAAELEGAYAEAASDDYIAEERGQRATARRALKTIERHVEPGRLLDLGCWVGFLMAEARERGWDCVGVEPSWFAASYARERLGLEVLNEDLLEAELQGRFDAVVMGDVIEHLPDPGAALDRIGELLHPAGVVWMALPDAGSPLARTLGRRWWSVIPTHVQYFTRDSIRLLLTRHGFEVVELRTAPKAFSVGYYLGRVGGYSRSLASLLVRGVRLAGVAERLWAPDLRDRMAVLARRSA